MKKHLLRILLLGMFMLVAALAWGQSVFYEEPFDTNQGWSLDPHWAIRYSALELSWQPSTPNYDLSATSPNIVVPETAGDVVVSQHIDEYNSGQGTPPETFEIIAVANGIPTVLWSYSTNADWGVMGGTDLALSLAPFAGQSIQLKFRATGANTYNFNYWTIYDIKAYASLSQDLAATSISGNTGPMLGIQNPYIITVRNTGPTNVSGYTVKLMKTGDVELASANGTAIAPGEIIQYTVPWTPAVVGETQLWAKVLLAGDQNPNNDETDHLSIFVIEPGLTIAEIGNGSAANSQTGTPSPYGTYHKNFRQQYLVLASELNAASGAAGNIYSVAFNVSALNSCTPMPNYRIRLKTTTQTALSTSFEAGTYSQVFQANEYMPVNGWNIHTFSTPFAWDGAANLLIDIVTDIIPGSYAHNASVPYTVTGFNSSLRYDSDYAPALNSSTGTASVKRSNLQFIMQALDITDLSALSITGPTTPSLNSTVNYTVTVKNCSPTALSNYTVKLMQSGGVTLGSANGTAIASQQTLEFTLPWIPTVVGQTQLYAKVLMAGDANPANDDTDLLPITVMEAGLLVAEIGTGTGTNTITNAPAPYGTFYKAFRQQLLYKADELYVAGAAPGLISALAFNVQNLDTCLPMANYTIRLKNTYQTALGTTFEVGDYITVWQRASFLPDLGWNMHSLDLPFFWDGSSNLLVDITCGMAADYSHNALSYLSPTTYASSLHFQSNTVNGSAGTTGDVANSRSNIRFFMTVQGMGSLVGTVTATGIPLAGAEIVVQNTVFSALSAADGTFSLPSVPVGAQTVRATMQGYSPQTHNVTIVGNQTTTLNFALSQLPQVAVTGRIVGSNAPTLGIAGASITLGGYEAYAATTDAAGYFSIPDVFTGYSYHYRAAAPGYAAATGEVVVGSTSVNMGNITVNEAAYPAHNVVATEAADLQSVNLSWQTPVPDGNGFEDDFEDYADFAADFGDWTTLDEDGSATYGFNEHSFPGSGSPMSYIVFNPSMVSPPLNLSAHSGNKFAACFASQTGPNNDWMITPLVMGGGQVSFWAKTHMHYGLERFKVGVSTTGTAPADFTIISGGSYVEAPMNWTEFVYDLSAYSGQAIHVAIQCVSYDSFSFFVDDLYVGNARARTASDAMQSSAPTYIVGTTTERAVVTPNPVKISSSRNSSRALVGYKVYRLLAGDQNNESNWTTLSADIISPTQYADNAWGPLPSGVYKYAVKALYTNNLMSYAAFSAELHKGMMGTLTGTVKEFGSGIGIAGATVTAGEYSGTTDAVGAYSFAVYAGNYSVSAAKTGYQNFSTNGVVIVGNQDTTLNFILTEIARPPSAVQAVDTGTNADITWMAPGSADGRWLHYDSGANSTSIGVGGPGNIDVAIRFPPSALSGYAGMSLQAIKVWATLNGTFTLKVWTGGTAAAPGTLVLSQPFTPNLGTYDLIPLSEPVLITGDEELWFGYNSITSIGYPIGCDEGPAVSGFGDMIYFNGHWNALSTLWPDLNFNFNIQGYVGFNGPDRGALLPLNTKVKQAERNAERALSGYKVWRLLQGQESNEALWISLTPSPISATAYQDTGWGTLPDGTHKWAVKAIYTGGTASIAAFSNPLVKYTQFGTILGFVRNSDNQPLAGATVACGTVSAITNLAGAYALHVDPGTYSVTASCPGYEPVTQDGVIVDLHLNTTANFVLSPALFQFEDGFESYPNFATTFAPWTLLDLDGSLTYGFDSTHFPGSGTAMSYIILNPSATTPPLTDSGTAHSGNKYAACFASHNPPNNDWLITPHFPGGGEIKFWAKTYMDYGLERFKVGVSTTGTAPADFTIISSGNFVEAPLEWTEYSYDLAAYAGQQIYVGIQCVSIESLAFMVDDVTITGAGTGTTSQNIPLVSGWNLVSLNVSASEQTLPTILASISGQVQQVKGTEGVYIAGNPYSTLSALTDGKAYNIQVSSGATWSVSGTQIPANTPLALTDGWNLTAYLPQNPLAVSTALQSISNWLQQVKGSDGVYLPGNPYSTLSAMYPGKGYWINLTGAHSLIYPAIRGANKTAVLSKPRVEVTKLPSSLVLLARCDRASPGDLLLAKVNGELRGAQELIAPEGFPAALLQIYTEAADEEISLWLLRADGSEIEIANRFTSQPNATLGSYPEFIILESKTGNEGVTALPNQLVSCYPNPFNPSTMISFTIAEDATPVSINIYNLRGQLVSKLENAEYPKGAHQIVFNGTDQNGSALSSGIYLIELKAGSYRKTAKAILAK